MQDGNLTPDVLANTLLSLKEEELAKMSHALLYTTRARVPREQQKLIAPFEHRAFAREVVTENPLMALPVAAAIPAYQIYKLLQGASSQSRSGASLEQVLQGFSGIGEGLAGTLNSLTFK